MKTSRIVGLCLVLALAVAMAEAPRKVALRDALRHEELANAKPRAAESLDTIEAPPPQAKTPTGTRPEWKPVNILERSEFLSFNGLGTLVPKGSVLHVPAGYRNRIGMAAGARIVPWAEFYRANRGWLSTHEVSRKQAEAEQPLTEAALESIAKSSTVVVATLAGGPITVLRPPPEEAAPTAATAPVQPVNRPTP